MTQLDRLKQLDELAKTRLDGKQPSSNFGFWFACCERRPAPLPMSKSFGCIGGRSNAIKITYLAPLRQSHGITKSLPQRPRCATRATISSGA